MSRAEFLTRSLLSTQKGLQGRLDAATVAQQNLQHAADEISIAALYGIDECPPRARSTQLLSASRRQEWFVAVALC